MSDAIAILAGLILGYGCGSIPFGLLLTRRAGLGDIRAIGSGNIGATNVLRTGRKGLAALTLLLDALKATVPILLAWHVLGRDAGLAAAAGAFLGHCFPASLRFRGGKGVATFIGCLLALSLPALAVFAVTWIAIAALSRYSSLAALAASLAAPAAAFWWTDRTTALVLVALAAVLWAKHAGNIARLLDGSEGRIGQKG